MKDTRWDAICHQLAPMTEQEQLAYLFAVIDSERQKPADQIDYALIDACSDRADRLATATLPDLTPARITQIRQRNDAAARARHRTAPALHTCRRALVAVAILSCLLCSLVVVASAKDAEMSVGEYIISVVTSVTATTEAPPKTAPPPPEPSAYEEDLQGLIDHCHRIRRDIDLLSAEAREAIPAALADALDAAIAGRPVQEELPSILSEQGSLTPPTAFRAALLRMTIVYPNFVEEEEAMVNLMGWLSTGNSRDRMTRDSFPSICYDAIFPAVTDWEVTEDELGYKTVTCRDFEGEILVEYATLRLGRVRQDALINTRYTDEAHLYAPYAVVCVSPVHPLGAIGEPHYFFFPENDSMLTLELIYKGNTVSVCASDGIDSWQLDYPTVSYRTAGEAVAAMLLRYPNARTLTVKHTFFDFATLADLRIETLRITPMEGQSYEDLSSINRLKELCILGREVEYGKIFDPIAESLPGVTVTYSEK